MGHQKTRIGWREEEEKKLERERKKKSGINFVASVCNSSE
jgi:hypothetical protein